MCRFIAILIVVTLVAGTVLSQAPDTVWTRTYGGGDTETFECAAALADDCFALGGYGRSFGFPDDAYIVKIDFNGDTLWTNSYGAATFDYLSGMVEAVDGNLVVAGRHALASGLDRLAWLFKVDDAGSIIWEKHYTGTYDLETRAVAPTADSGFILAGYHNVGSPNYDFWMLKTDSVGDSLWFKTFGAAGDDRPTKVLQTSDGGYVLVGTTKSFDVSHLLVWIVRTDAAGDTLWTYTCGTIDYNELDPCLTRTGADTYLLATSSYDIPSTLYAPHLVEFEAGPTAINILYEGHTLLDRSATISAVHRCQDGGTLISGNASGYPYPLGTQAILAKLDASFDTVWTTSIGGDGTDRAVFVHEASNNQIIIAGQWYAATVEAQFYAVKYQPSVLSVGDDVKSLLPEGYALEQNYPNPFNPSTRIDFELPERLPVKVEVLNVLGQKVATLLNRTLGGGKHFVHWHGSDDSGDPVAAGVYLYRLTAGDQTASRKMLLLK